LLGGAPDAPPLRPPEDGGPPVIVAESSAVQDLMEGARNVLARADGVMKTVEAVVSDNRAEIARVITNVRVFTDALAKNSDQVSAFLEGMGTAARQVGSLADRLQGFVSEVEEVVKAIDVHGVRDTVNNTRDFTAALAKIGPRMDKLFEDAPVLSQTLRQAAARLDTVLASAQTIIGRVDPDKVGKAVDNVTAFSDTLNQNRQNVDDVVRHARELAQRVNEGSKRLDSILSKTDALLGTANDTGLMEEVRKAAQSIQTLADNLDKRADEISIGLNRFSNQGLRELELLISNGRSTLSDVDQVVRDFQRSPSQFLFGKSGIPDYSRGR
jgi:phospholipid/cholesterol/gamma-HCH transport system substrate-binding protein